MNCVWSKTIGSSIIKNCYQVSQFCGSSVYKPKKAITKRLLWCLTATWKITSCIFQVHMSNKERQDHTKAQALKKNTKSPLSTTSAKSPPSSILLFFQHFYSTEKKLHCSNHTKKNPIKYPTLSLITEEVLHYFICNKFHITLIYYYYYLLFKL